MSEDIEKGIDQIIEVLSDTWNDLAREEGNVIKIYIGKSEEGDVTNYVEIKNGSSSIGTGIGGFKSYLEMIGPLCTDIMVNEVLLDKEQRKAVIEAVLDDKYLRLNDED